MTGNSKQDTQTVINLSGQSLDDQAILNLTARIRTAPQITEVDLSNCTFSPNCTYDQKIGSFKAPSLSALAKALAKHPNLETLNLLRISVNQASVRELRPDYDYVVKDELRVIPRAFTVVYLNHLRRNSSIKTLSLALSDLIGFGSKEERTALRGCLDPSLKPGFHRIKERFLNLIFSGRHTRKLLPVTNLTVRCGHSDIDGDLAPTLAKGRTTLTFLFNNTVGPLSGERKAALQRLANANPDTLITVEQLATTTYQAQSKTASPAPKDQRQPSNPRRRLPRISNLLSPIVREEITQATQHLLSTSIR